MYVSFKSPHSLSSNPPWRKSYDWCLLVFCFVVSRSGTLWDNLLYAILSLTFIIVLWVEWLVWRESSVGHRDFLRCWGYSRKTSPNHNFPSSKACCSENMTIPDTKYFWANWRRTDIFIPTIRNSYFSITEQTFLIWFLMFSLSVNKYERIPMLHEWKQIAIWLCL